MKYSANKTLSDPFKSVDDNTLRAIEYGGFSYLIDVYHKGKSPINKAIALSLMIGVYEYSLQHFYAPAETQIKYTTKMNDSKGEKK